MPDAARWADNHNIRFERVFAFRVKTPDEIIHAFGYTCDEARDALTACGLAAEELPVILGGDPTCPACLDALTDGQADG